jgi:hypothetical protein
LVVELVHVLDEHDRRAEQRGGDAGGGAGCAVNEWAAADSFIRFGFVDRDATVGATAPARGRAVRMRRAIRARMLIVSVALMRVCFIGSSFASGQRITSE